MSRRQLLIIALRYTLNLQGGYLSGFLSRLSMVSIVLAIGLLLVVLSVMNGFDREMREHILAVVPQLTLRSLHPIEDWERERSTIAVMPRVRGVEPFVQMEGMLLHRGRIDTAIVNGTLPRPAAESGVGQPPLPSHFSSDGIVLGAALAAKLRLEVGDPVTLITRSPEGTTDFAYLRLDSVLDTGTEWDHSAALLHLDTASRLAGLGGAVHGFRIGVEDVFEAASIGWQLVRDLPPGYYASDWTMTHGNLYAAIQLSRDLIGLLLLSIIAIAAFNVVSSLVLVVLDKRGDIAILRAQGATPGDIRMLFLLQGLSIAGVGILLGSVVGVAGSYWVGDLVAAIESLFEIQFLNTEVYFIDYLPADLLWSDVLGVGMVTALLCFLAALYPAHRAAGFLPAEVLRHQ